MTGLVNYSSSLVAIRGTEGKDLTIPCYAPPYLNNPSLNWNFSNGEDPSHILTYDSRSGHSVSSPPWEIHVELDAFRVPFGDGSLRLMDPEHSEHSGSYTCVFSVPYNTHTERTDVTIDTSVGEVANTNTVINTLDKSVVRYLSYCQQIPMKRPKTNNV